MINQTKKGFSLAEVLVSLAIVSVIATMGFSIAKKGLASAYNGYYFTGYDAINKTIHSAYAKYPDNPDKRLKYIQMTLSLDKDLNNLDTDEFAIAPNGIGYKINNTEIKMRVPSVKTKYVKKPYRIVRFIYHENSHNLLIIVPPDNNEKDVDGYVDIRERSDLLAFKCITENDMTEFTHVLDENGNITDIVKKSATPAKPISYSEISDLINSDSCLSIVPVKPIRIYR